VSARTWVTFDQNYDARRAGGAHSSVVKLGCPLHRKLCVPTAHCPTTLRADTVISNKFHASRFLHQDRSSRSHRLSVLRGMVTGTRSINRSPKCRHADQYTVASGRGSPQTLPRLCRWLGEYTAFDAAPPLPEAYSRTNTFSLGVCNGCQLMGPVRLGAQQRGRCPPDSSSNHAFSTTRLPVSAEFLHFLSICSETGYAHERCPSASVWVWDHLPTSIDCLEVPRD
jgi:hypothetical protein